MMNRSLSIASPVTFNTDQIKVIETSTKIAHESYQTRIIWLKSNRPTATLQIPGTKIVSQVETSISQPPRSESHSGVW